MKYLLEVYYFMKAKVCGSGEDMDVYLRIEADGIQPRHCRFWMSSDSKTVNVSNISKEGCTWIKLRYGPDHLISDRL